MFSCCGIKNDLSAFLDDELPEKRRKQIAEHLRNCPDCEKNLEIMRRENLILGQYFRMKKSHAPVPHEAEINSFLESIEESSSPVDTEPDTSRKNPKEVITSLTRKFFVEEIPVNVDVSSSGTFVIHGHFHIMLAFLAIAGILLLFASELHGF